MPNWRRERDLLLIALAFLTRIPIPATTPHTPANLNAAARYFPLIGALVGTCATLTYLIAIQIWPTGIAVALSMTATVLLTGAFHEDGFADSCDGFGGGWRREQVLAIMKDSRIGSYAAIGLVLLLALKFLSLFTLAQALVPASPRIVIALIFGHACSRLLAISYLYNFVYVRDDDSSKVKPLATQINRNDLLLAGLSIAPLLLFLSPLQSTLIIAALLLWRWGFGRYMQRRIGGYTGDCLGAAQQIAEVLIYLALVAA
ncbi:MAG TPA: adenosylcobinamide-GDP ribazoletransferase [Spongiibacteraceae bacterium]|jgi:adenosylcobinamide-GDP ribazoletransferase